MNTCTHSIACAVMRQPSISRCGTLNMISRSLNVPGSDSSALTTRYVGLPVPFARNDAFFPIGKPAPPRPRTFAARSSSRSACSGTELLDDRRDVVRADRLAVAVVDRDDRTPAAAACALDRPQRDGSIRRGLARGDPQLALERLEHLLRADEGAGDVRADLDEVLPHRSQVEHVVEGRNRLAVRGGQPERLADVAECLGRQPAVALLGRAQRRQHGRADALRIAGADLLDLVVEAGHRSTSPMTPSSEPTIAIRSATSASRESSGA